MNPPTARRDPLRFGQLVLSPLGSPAVRVLSEGSPARPRTINAPFIKNNRLRNSPAGGRVSASTTREPVRGGNSGEGGNLFAFGRDPATATAPAGPERHWRKRRGPSAGDGLGNRGAIRAGLLCRDREHGGTQAVSRRSGSPREAQSEGPKVLLFLLGRAGEASDRTRRAGEPRGATRWVPTSNPGFRYFWIRGNWGSER